MQFFIGWRVIIKRIKAIRFMMKDKSVPKRKKALVVVGIIYLFLPIDLIPPILFPIAWIDDLILWIFILYHLRETLDQYWMGSKPRDYSKKYKDTIDDVEFEVKEK
ncbi:MAG: DUF1232 domain-containing protein [Anaerovoracaceae bacterium]